MVQDYCYHRPGRSRLTLISLIVFVVVALLIYQNDDDWVIALLPFIFALKAAYDLWRNPTYGVELNNQTLTILPTGTEIEFRFIAKAVLRDRDGQFDCKVHMYDRRIVRIGSKSLPPSWKKFGEELEARGVAVEYPWGP